LHLWRWLPALVLPLSRVEVDWQLGQPVIILTIDNKDFLIYQFPGLPSIFGFRQQRRTLPEGCKVLLIVPEAFQY
jgi:hypothetical protein